MSYAKQEEIMQCRLLIGPTTANFLTNAAAVGLGVLDILKSLRTDDKTKMQTVTQFATRLTHGPITQVISLDTRRTNKVGLVPGLTVMTLINDEVIFNEDYELIIEQTQRTNATELIGKGRTTYNVINNQSLYLRIKKEGEDPTARGPWFIGQRLAETRDSFSPFAQEFEVLLKEFYHDILNWIEDHVKQNMPTVDATYKLVQI